MDRKPNSQVAKKKTIYQPWVDLRVAKIDIRQERFHYECQDRFLIGLQLDSLL